jgi:hypothetical protein
MRIRQLCGTLALLGTVSLFGTSAQATLVFFNDRTTWENTLGGTITTEDFNAVTPFVLSAGSNPAGQIDISLSNVSGSVNRIGDISEFWLIDGTTGFLGAATPNGAENISVDLPERVFGWGADFSTTHSGAGLTLEIDSILAEFSDILPGGENGTGFLGVISTNAFSSVRLFDAEQNETFGMDNVSFGDGTFVATAVSEPTALAILGLGLAGLGLSRRRSRAAPDLLGDLDHQL